MIKKEGIRTLSRHGDGAMPLRFRHKHDAPSRVTCSGSTLSVPVEAPDSLVNSRRTLETWAKTREDVPPRGATCKHFWIPEHLLLCYLDFRHPGGPKWEPEVCGHHSLTPGAAGACSDSWIFMRSDDTSAASC